MSDEQTPTTDPDENTPQDPAQEPDWKSFSRKWEDRAKAANAELEELRKRASKLDELEEKQKTAEQKQAEELEKLRARAAELESELSKKDRDILAREVAAEKGVKPKYLHGDTREELVASAEEFLADIGGIAPAVKPGVVRSAGTGDPKAKVDTVADAKARAAAKYGVSK